MTEPSQDADRMRLSAGLGFRFHVLLAIGMLVPAAFVAAIGWSRLLDLDDRMLRGREEAAALVAVRLQAELAVDLEMLQRLAAVSRGALGADKPVVVDPGPFRQGRAQFRFLGSVFLLDGEGRVLLEEPIRERSAAPAPDVPALREVLATSKPAITGLVSSEAGAHAWALVAVTDWQGRAIGAVGGVLDHALWREPRPLSMLALRPGGSAVIVDSRGAVLAGTAGADALPDGCFQRIADVARARRPDRGSFPECQIDGNVVVAAAPVGLAPWAVAIVEPAEVVLASTGILPSSFPLLAVALLLISGAFAWGITRSVTRPVATLTSAAERIAGGVFEPPIPDLGDDEVGRLGASLEDMRVALRDLVAERARHAQDLERRVAERTRELAGANEQLRERDEARARLLRMVITAQEDERKRIARELHDDTTQKLAVLVMAVERASQALRGEGRPVPLDEVKQLAVSALDEVHRLIRDLRPSVLDDLGLYSAVRWYAEKTLSPRGIAVRCELGDPEPELPAAWDIALFRICQEAVNNVARHANAESVLIQLGVERDELRIEIEDDGRGFDTGRSGAGDDRPHWGLIGIQERAELLGGIARIDSSPGHGTRVELRVPLPEAARRPVAAAAGEG